LGRRLIGWTKAPATFAGAGGALAMVVLVLLFAGGRCNFVFHPSASNQPTPTPQASSPGEPTPSGGPSDPTTPTASSTPREVSTSTPTPTAASGRTSTPTPAAGPTPTPPPALAVSSLPWLQGEVGVPYPSVQLGASGGTPPYRWSAALPAGLSLAANGSVSGTPTATGSPFTVQVDDSAGRSATAATSIPIAPALQLSYAPACTGSVCSVESGCDTVCGTFGQLSGGVGPYQYPAAPSSGSLPRGTKLNGLSLVGPIVNSAQFAVGVTDSLNATASLTNVTFTVFPHVALSNGRGSGPVPGPVTAQMPLVGGYGPVTKVVVVNAPKIQVTGFTYDAAKAILTITLQGTFTAGSTTVQVMAYDSYACDLNGNCNATAIATLSIG
jgi:hypothetical protein